MTTPLRSTRSTHPSAERESADASDRRRGSSSPHLADTVADAIKAVPGVADLHTGAFGEVATYLPGRRVNGVRLRDDVTEVHVVLTWGASLLDTADRIRIAVAALVTTPVEVTIEDVVGPS